MKQSTLGFSREAMALLFAAVSLGCVNAAQAGAGWGLSTDRTGAAIAVPTYYANSPSGLRPDVSPTAAPGAMINTGTPLRKFVDTLPGLGVPNNLGQYIPVAVADKNAYPGSDYYEIGIVEYTEKMHSDLPKATTLRGYVQLETASNAASSKHIALTYPSGAPILDAGGKQVFAVDNPHYMGPLINATRGVAVRIKYSNLLPKGHYDPITRSRGGDLFLPVDTTLTGAGLGPDGINSYTQNRAMIHLHGGDTPWISDGTPHQWIAPAGEATPYTKGASFQNVPDMPDPGPGSGTLYYPNNQSARMMFYHDHTAGLTRVNVYGGIAAGYLLSDTAEQGLVNSKALPATQIPLIIQDKTFVPKDVLQQDAKWGVQHWGQPGDLWFPHVYETNQDPNSFDGTNPVGRWDYGPWFWPVFPAPLPLPTGEPGNASTTPEAFMDTPVVNGTAYPALTVQPQAYRFRILNASNDRFINLGLYEAEPLSIAVTNGGAGYSASPVVVVSGGGGTGATAKAIVAAGVITDITVTNPGTGYTSSPNISITDATGKGATAVASVFTEVKMVPAKPGNLTWPATWPTDGRAGGVPDPATTGPDIVQIGNEGGFLPAPAVIPSTPNGYEYNRRSVTVLNVSTHGLFMGPAERADVVIDFSGYCPGTKFILYNDSPAPVPGFDPRIDYYTGNPDHTAVGGAPSTLPGYGPNTRTVMQFVVAGTPSPTCVRAAFTQDPNPNIKNPTLTALQTALPAAYAASQPKPVVAEAAYSGLWGSVFSNTYAGINTGSIRQPNFTFTDPVKGSLVTLPVQNKAIQELFDPNYGRMNATLGVELPFTSALTQTTIPLGYVDPATETIADGETQIWKITHNGVDSHPVHFHLVNVQLINRVGWDGTVKPADENEQGWKETVRMNPLEDIIVAVRAKAPVLPFGVPESVRALDPTQKLGVATGFTQVNANTGLAAVVTNVTSNFGWEYVWHCHILGHEENDFMRPFIFKYSALAPTAPSSLTLAAGTLNWTDPTPAGAASTFGNAQNEVGFRIERSSNYGAFTAIGTAPANATSFTDKTAAAPLTDYSYRVVAYNAAGDSLPSNTVTQVSQPGSLTPASLAFAAQAVGTTSGAQTLTFANTGIGVLGVGGTMSITGISISGVNAKDFVQTNTCGTSLAAGSNCSINVTYSPTASGASAAMLTVATSSGLKATSLSGTGLGAAATLSPSTPMTFAAQQTATASATQTVTLTNGGTNALLITGISIGGSNPLDFTQTNNCGTSLAAGTRCTINLSFTPSAAGTRSALLTVVDGAGTQTLSLSGLGVAPSATLNPAAPMPLAFPAQQVGTTSAPSVATLTNTGVGPVTVSAITISGTNPADFAQTNNCPRGPATLASGASCTINVTFTPTAIDPRAATLNVATSAGTMTSALSGGAQAPSAAVTPASLAFGAQLVGVAGTTQLVTLSNTGVGLLSISGITIGGANPFQFAQTNNCGTSLAKGTSCTINVSFAPNAGGAKTAVLTIVDAAGTQMIPLTGTGSTFTLTPSTALSFGTQLIGTSSASQAVTLANTGTAAIPASLITLGGANPFQFGQTNNCGTSLAPAATCTINVAFKPAAGVAPGAKTALLAVGAQTVTLNGTAAVQSATLTPSTALSFGTQLIGTSSAPQAVTLANTGTAAIPASLITLGGANPFQFAQTNNCGTSLAPSASCTINVAFKPVTGVAPGAKTASLTVGAQTVALNGTATNLAATLTPAVPLAFGTQLVGVAGVPQAVKLTNSGSASLSITGITLGGANPFQFAQTNNCGASLAPAASCTINVSFTPNAGGTKSATLTVVDAAGTQTVALNGTGAVLSATLAPSAALSFGTQLIGTASTAQAVTLTNTGTTAIPASLITLGGANPFQFAQTNNCGTSLPPAATCTINVSFKPATGVAPGVKTASLTVGTQSVTLNGTASNLAATLTPASLAFGTQLVGAAGTGQRVTLTNSGNAALPVTSIMLGGANPFQFAQTNNCGTSLALAASCTINVSFVPNAGGAKSATLTVVDAAGTQTVALTGTGSAYTLTPSTALSFGTQLIGTSSAPQVLTLANTGTVAIPASLITLGGANPFQFAQANNCGTSLAPAATCTINVSFKPAAGVAPGAKTASLTVGIQTVALSGTAQ